MDAALRHCDTVAGYSNYVDFIRDRIIGKPIIQNGMMGEVARCRATLWKRPAAGQEVCMVCSGDPGILAMAGLLFELRAREPRFGGYPDPGPTGITAATIAAASLGAPLQNGFSLVSLSDLLVPADEVRRNIRLRGPIACCRWRSLQPRRAQTAGICWTEALAVFREQRGRDVLCAYVKNAGRASGNQMGGQAVRVPRRRGGHVHAHHYRRPRTRL